MNYPEFLEVMQSCIRQFGVDEFNDRRLKLVYARCHRLGLAWTSRVVDQMCLRNDRFFDFEEAARNEFNRRNGVQRTEAIVEALKELDKHRTDQGYLEKMRLFGATNFWDAVENCRKFKMHDMKIDELEAVSEPLCKELGVK